MHITPYELRMQEVAQSGCPCVLIDESGTPGQQAGSHYLHHTRKTWVSVIASARQALEICEQIPGALEELKEHTGANEFHFTDIYRGDGVFKKTPLQLRLGLFAAMCHLFNIYKFPVIVQTLNPDNLSEIRERTPVPDILGPFDMSQPSDAALLFLLWRVKQFLIEHKAEFTNAAYVALDEGFRPAGRVVALPNFENVFHRNSFFTVKSSEFYPIQLADFAAFWIGKTQWLMTKAQRSKTDDAFLGVMANLRLNVINLPQTLVDLSTWTPRDYERLIDEDREEKGLKPYRAAEG